MKGKKLITSFAVLFVILLMSGCTMLSSITISIEDDISIEVNGYFDINDIVQIHDGDTRFRSVNDYIEFNDFDSTTLGDYTINLNYDGGFLSKESREFIIHVIDTTAPVITLTGTAVVDINFGDPYVDLGVTVLDNYDKELEVQIDESLVDIDKMGIYEVYYNAVDTNGNIAKTVTRFVNVTDVEAPDFTMSKFFVYNGGAPIDWESKITNIDDNFDTEYTIEIDDSGVNYAKVGVYIVYVTVADTKGNSETRYINVTVTAGFTEPLSVPEITYAMEYVTIDFDQEFKDTFTVKTYSLRLYYYNGKEFIDEPVEGYQDIPCSVDNLHFENLEKGKTYILTLNGTPFYSDEMLKKTVYLNYENVFVRSDGEVYSTIANLTISVYSEYFDDFIKADLIEVKTGTIVKTWNDEIEKEFSIDGLTPDTDYEMKYIFTTGSSSFEFTTRPQILGDTIMMNYHVLKANGDYSNSRIVIWMDNQFNLYPITTTDDFGGVVEVALDFDTYKDRLDEFKIAFIPDYTEGTLMDINDFSKLDTILLQDSIYLEADYYLFEGDLKPFLLLPDMGAMFILYGAYNIFDDRFIDIYYNYNNNGDPDEFNYDLFTPKELRLLTSEIDGIEVIIPVIIIEVGEETSEDTYVSILNRPLRSKHELYIDNSGIRGSGIEVNYFILQEQSLRYSADQFFTQLQNEIRFSEFTPINKVYYSNFILDNFDALVTIYLQAPANVSEFYNSITITYQDTSNNSEILSIESDDYINGENHLNLTVKTEIYDISYLGVIGDFNDWDKSNPYLFELHYDGVLYLISDLDYFEYEIIYDSDKNGFDENDLIITDRLSVEFQELYSTELHNIVFTSFEEYLFYETEAISFHYRLSSSIILNRDYMFEITYTSEEETITIYRK